MTSPRSRAQRDVVRHAGHDEGARIVLFVEDLTRALGRSASTVRRLIRRGELGPFNRIGGRLCVRRDALLAHLADHEVPVDAQGPRSRDRSVRRYEEMLWGKNHGRT